MRGIHQIQIVKRIRLVRKIRINGDYMICMGMYGNGVRIGITIIIVERREMEVPGNCRQVRFVSCVGALGATIPGSAVLLTATGIFLSIGATVMAFGFVVVWCVPSLRSYLET